MPSKLVKITVNVHELQSSETHTREWEANLGELEGLHVTKIEFAEIRYVAGFVQGTLDVWLRCEILEAGEIVPRQSFYVVAVAEGEDPGFNDKPLCASGAWLLYGYLGRPGLSWG